MVSPLNSSFVESKEEAAFHSQVKWSASASGVKGGGDGCKEELFLLLFVL